MVIGLEKHHIALTSEEAALVGSIDLRLDHGHHEDGHAIYLSNCDPIMALLKSLSGRSAIPPHRLAYWNDPKYQTGRVKGSYEDIFARNGSSGREAYTHPHFLPFLRYFLFGADLPPAAMVEFEGQIGDPRWFSGSDILGLTKRTRAIVRKYGLRSHNDADEFQKLAIDNGLSPYNAASVRKAAIEGGRR